MANIEWKISMVEQNRQTREFLSQASPAVSGRFEYFRNLLENLREDMNAEEYRKLLPDYLRQFLEIAERN